MSFVNSDSMIQNVINCLFSSNKYKYKNTHHKVITFRDRLVLYGKNNYSETLPRIHDSISNKACMTLTFHDLDLRQKFKF